MDKKLAAVVGIAAVLTGVCGYAGAAPEDDHAYLDRDSRGERTNGHGVGLTVCTDHDARAFVSPQGLHDEPGSDKDLDRPSRSTPVDSPRTWTFLFYDDADFTNAYDPFYNFVGDACSSPNVNVLVLRDVNYGPADLYYVDEQHNAHRLQPWGEVSMGRYTTLKRFIKYGKAHYPADRYIVAMYDHGGGWTGACVDVTNGGFLSMRDIARGIGEAGGIDILAFSAPCTMGAMESVYEVRDCVDVYIGSEDLSGYIYWLDNMGAICDVLENSEALSNEDIGRKIIEIIESGPNWGWDPENDWSTMSAMKTSDVTLAAQQLDVISEYMSVHSALLLDDLEWSRANTWLLGSGANFNTKSVDLYDFTVRLAERVSDPVLLESLQHLRNLLDDAIIAECNQQPSTSCRPHGLSLYFPVNFGQFAVGSYDRVLDLTRDTKWEEFLREYYRCQSLPRGNLAGSVLAECPSAGTPLEGVTVTACQSSTGDLLGAAVTDQDGSYKIRGLLADNYTVAAVSPLGYEMTTAGAGVRLPGGTVNVVDLELSCTGESHNPNGAAFWRRALRTATGGDDQALVDVADLCAYLDAIDAHFSARGIDVCAPPATSTCDAKLQAAVDLLSPPPPVKAIGGARCHLMALLLNVAAGHMRTTDIISKDGATVSQAITYCSEMLSVRPVEALVVANLVNNGCTIARGRIPLSTPHILFSPPEQPTRAAPERLLSVDVRPNPFNPTTTISFTVPRTSHVTLAIYDVAGRRIDTLVDGAMEPGLERVVWDGRDASGNALSSGVYFYRVEAGGETAIGKLLLLK